MKYTINYCSSLLYLFLLLPAFSFGQNFLAVWPDQVNFYACSIYQASGASELRHLPTALDRVDTAGGLLTLYPSYTLRVGNVGLDEENIMHHSWLGKRIEDNLSSQEITFYYDDVFYNKAQKKFVIDRDKKLLLNLGPTIFYLDDDHNFKCTRVSLSGVWHWNDITDQTYIYEVENLSGNSNYHWTKDSIIISRKHGLISFPNLQYFPYEWRRCDFSGIQKERLGVYKPSWPEMLYMQRGDEYHTKRVTIGGTTQYVINKCSRVIEEDASRQIRQVHRNILTNDGSGIWVETQDSIEQTMVTGKYGLGTFPDDTLTKDDNTNEYIYLSVINGMGYNYLAKGGFLTQENTYRLPLDEFALDYFTIRNGCDYYYDFTSFAPDYYIPLYSRHGTKEWGDKVDFATISVKNIKEQKYFGTISPNPSQGSFTYSAPEMAALKEFYVLSSTGYRTPVYYESRSDQSVKFQLTAPPGVYIIHGINQQGGQVYLGRVIIVK